MGRSSKKPRQNKLDVKKATLSDQAPVKKERDWTFEDILRSKSRGR